MRSELQCNGASVEFNDFVSEFMAHVTFGTTAMLQGVKPEAAQIVVERGADLFKITSDGEEIEWFMDYPRAAILAVIDAAVRSLKGCDGATTYTLGVRR